MLELYQSEDCPDCARARERLRQLGLVYVIRSVPMDRARRDRVTEAGGRPDIPLLLDPERGRTTYEADEIVEVLGSEDHFGVDTEAEPGLAHLYQREGEAESDKARRVLGEAGLDYVMHHARPGDAAPRLVEPSGGASRTGVAQIEDWAKGFRLRG
jgi:glutaredoxin